MAPPTRHPTLYFDEPDTIIFQVEDTLFRPHKFLLARYCELFRGMFDISENSTSQENDMDDLHPVKLADITLPNGVTYPELTAAEFELGLKVIYPEQLRHLTVAPLDSWKTVLEIAQRWGSDHLCITAVAYIEQFHTLSASDRLILAAKHGINQWLHDAYVGMCLRRGEINAEESSYLPPLFSNARERARHKIISLVSAFFSNHEKFCAWNQAGPVLSFLDKALDPAQAGIEKEDIISTVLERGRAHPNSPCYYCKAQLPVWEHAARKAVDALVREKYPSEINLDVDK